MLTFKGHTEEHFKLLRVLHMTEDLELKPWFLIAFSPTLGEPQRAVYEGTLDSPDRAVFDFAERRSALDARGHVPGPWSKTSDRAPGEKALAAVREYAAYRFRTAREQGLLLTLAADVARERYDEAHAWAIDRLRYVMQAEEILKNTNLVDACETVTSIPESLREQYQRIMTMNRNVMELGVEFRIRNDKAADTARVFGSSKWG